MRPSSELPSRAGGPGPSADEVTGVVLCGGRSRRMGQDKARLELDGISLLERAVGVLRPLSAEVLLATGVEPRYPELGLERVVDLRRDCGPLAGIEAALTRSGREYLCCLACDMPRVDTAQLRALLQIAAARGADAVIPRTPRGDEPLCAIYRRTCLDPVRSALDDDRRRIVALADYKCRDGRPLLVEFPSVDSLPGTFPADANVNTTEEWERVRHALRTQGD